MADQDTPSDLSAPLEGLTRYAPIPLVTWSELAARMAPDPTGEWYRFEDFQGLLPFGLKRYTLEQRLHWGEKEFSMEPSNEGEWVNVTQLHTYLQRLEEGAEEDRCASIDPNQVRKVVQDLLEWVEQNGGNDGQPGAHSTVAVEQARALLHLLEHHHGGGH